MVFQWRNLISYVGCTTGSCQGRRLPKILISQVLWKLTVAFFGDDVIKKNYLAYRNMCIVRTGLGMYIPRYSHTTTGSICIYISGTVIWIASICMSPCRIPIWHIRSFILCDLFDELTLFYFEFSDRMSLYIKLLEKISVTTNLNLYSILKLFV